MFPLDSLEHLLPQCLILSSLEGSNVSPRKSITSASTVPTITVSSLEGSMIPLDSQEHLLTQFIILSSLEGSNVSPR